MAGVPSAVTDGPWWWLFCFLLVLVFFRAQATYWLGRWVRHGLAIPADAEAGSVPQPSSRRARIAARFSGPTWDRAERFLDRWGFIGVPLSFLTIGFQTMVNAAAGFGRMRWDLYTVAMIPGCAMWALVYSAAGFSLVSAWKTSPWIVVAAVLGVVALAGVFTRLRRRRVRASTDVGV